DLARIIHHMIVGDDIAVRFDDEARAGGLRAWGLRSRRSPSALWPGESFALLVIAKAEVAEEVTERGRELGRRRSLRARRHGHPDREHRGRNALDQIGEAELVTLRDQFRRRGSGLREHTRRCRRRRQAWGVRE